MVPRAIARKGGPTVRLSSDVAAEEGMSVKKSNEDFRNLLLKKN